MASKQALHRSYFLGLGVPPALPEIVTVARLLLYPRGLNSGSIRSSYTPVYDLGYVNTLVWVGFSLDTTYPSPRVSRGVGWSTGRAQNSTDNLFWTFTHLQKYYFRSLRGILDVLMCTYWGCTMILFSRLCRSK